MDSQRRKKYYSPALLFAALALFWAAISFVAPASAQKLKRLPPPPPGPIYKPKPTPTPAPEELEVVRVTSNLIAVPVSVTDAAGQPVVGLRPTDFRIEEDGQPQQVAQIADPEQVPLDIALLIDVSGSVVARFDFERQAAADFLKHVLKAEDRAAIFAIDEKPRQVEQFANAQKASQKLLTIVPSRSYTAFVDSVLAAARYLDKNSTSGRRRIIVVISDGDDTARILNVSAAQSRKGDLNLIGVNAQIELMQKAQQEIQREVQRAEITFYSINPSGQTMHLNVRTARSQQALERTALATGGAAFVPRNEADLPNIFQRIASEIRTQYLLQYYSTNKASGTAFRRIKVTTPAQPQLRVRSREGYFSKAK